MVDVNINFVYEDTAPYLSDLLNPHYDASKLFGVFGDVVSASFPILTIAPLLPILFAWRMSRPVKRQLSASLPVVEKHSSLAELLQTIIAMFERSPLSLAAHLQGVKRVT